MQRPSVASLVGGLVKRRARRRRPGAAEHVFVSEDTPVGEAATEADIGGGYRGYANMTAEEIAHWVETCDAHDVQLLAHTNGDGATIIRAQTMREDQLDVARISLAKSALNRGIAFTLHHDAPVAGIGMLPVAAASVIRVTSSGKPVGPEQKITPFEALRAITHDAAWQYFQEDRKGERSRRGRSPTS